MDSSSSSSLLQGFELGKFVLSSGLLQTSWGKISEIHQSQVSNQNSGLGIKIYQEAKYTLVVFVAPPIRRNSSGLTRLSESNNPFHFLCSEKISSFSVYTPAFELFVSAYRGNLRELKSKLLELLKSDKSVIITGAALGGSVASLFTLWLLETIDPTHRRPLCITFGAPLIGDAFLQQILENSLRNSCFLHVGQGLDVATKAAQTPIEPDSLKPFGTFLICFDSECICIEDPEATMELLVGVNTDDLVEWRDYGDILQRLDQTSITDSKLMIDDVIIRMEGRKKLRFDPLKKLNNMKISLIHIEWYKKESKINKIGYYNRYKSKLLEEVDMIIERRKKELNDFWKSMVEEVEKKPQSDKSILKMGCLYAGNNYRRIIEPLDIDEYYSDGRRDYRTSGRSRHYVKLEKWFKEDEKKKAEEEKIEPVRCKNTDLSDLLTFDSCFWAEVEDSLIVINLMKTQVGMGVEERIVLMGKLTRFEQYVWGMIGKREVSPEIFLEESSFMKWWREYKWINGSDSDSPASNFTEFMNTGKYERYGQSQ